MRRRRLGTDEHHNMCNLLECPRWLHDGWRCRLEQSILSYLSVSHTLVTSLAHAETLQVSVLQVGSRNPRALAALEVPEVPPF